ncbi:TetR/AcrR family transcriptional regulator [Sulfuriflexus mobilis]|uniref:TetR/AcrR family transcriptional regulator n=1 Tax=Sulfuriflexus mobilis TaxID=1811807 RepID=UPI000F81DDE3|nr:TetR/AcrR family transcriptional regulator [Sulfuriflexus mobilis]
MSSDNSETTRDRILNAAWGLLEASHGKGVRMTDIAKQAGISRQALYLHFSKRSELLIATTRYIDEVKGVDARFEASRKAKIGTERLDAFIDAWGNYIPEIYGVAKALLAMKDTDEAADLAWDDRMQAVRHGCETAIMALANDGTLLPEYTPEQATDILWTMLSVRNWEQLTMECKWSQENYIKTTKSLARRILVVG